MSPTRHQQDDDGATTIRTGPHSGLNSDFVTSSMYIGDSLPEGLRLGEYEILSVIGEGGFGIVYLAYDHFLQRQVALKEYMPSSLAGRSRMGLEVTIKSERHRDTFAAGLKSFINEARLLAQFDHRALVKVYRFWEGNGTAYMVMPYVVGPTLKAALAEMPALPSEGWLREQVLTPLMEALTLLHKASCLHRDIAPDNILLTETGPMLLDFGAARKVIGDLNQTLTVVLKPGYAPIEQYGEVAALTQGPWTDVYALGGVVRYAITGKVPVSATTRLVQDTMVPMAQLAAGQYSEAFLQAVDAALAVKPADRPQDMAQLAAWLDALAAPVVGAVPAAMASVPAVEAEARTAGPRTVGPRAMPPSPPVETAQAGLATRPWPATVQPELPAKVPAPRQEARYAAQVSAVPAMAEATTGAMAAPSTARPGRLLGWVLGGLLVLAMGAVAWLMFRPAAPALSVSPTSAEVVPPAIPAASAVAPVVAAEPGPTPPASAAAATSVTQPAIQPAVSAPGAAASAPLVPPTPVARTQPPAPQARSVAPSAETNAPTSKPPSVAQAVRPSPPGGEKASRCSDLLQKASLEPLTSSETSFLKTECR